MLQLSSYKYINAVFIIITVIFLITCTSSSSWRHEYYKDSSDYKVNGLWRVCEYSGRVQECGEYFPGGWVHASRTFMILAILFAAGAVVYTFGVYMTVGDPAEMKLWRSSILLLLTAFLTMVGMSVYTANETVGKATDGSSVRGYAFTFGWASFVLSLISAFTSLVADRR